MQVQFNKNRSPRAPRNTLSVKTNVAHIYDRSARGRVVDHDTDEKGRYISSLVFVDWGDGQGVRPVLPEELIDLTPRSQQGNGRQNNHRGRR